MELKPQWIDFCKRLQSMARKYEGLVIMNVVIVASGDGVPQYWLPFARPLEPKMNANIDEMRKHMSEEELQQLLKAIVHELRFSR